MLVLEYIFKMDLCPDILSQNIRKSGFGASDELSSEEEEGSPTVEVIRPIPHQERHPAATWPTSAPVSSVRKRNLKSNPKPIVRPQVIVALFVNETGVATVVAVIKVEVETVMKLQLDLLFT